MEEKQGGEGEPTPAGATGTTKYSVAINTLKIEPEEVFLVRFTLSPGGDIWARYDFQLYDASGKLYDSWYHWTNATDPIAAATTTDSTTVELYFFDISPPLAPGNFTFQMNAMTKTSTTTPWAVVAGRMPLPPAAATAEFLPNPPRLAVDWQWSDSFLAGTTVQFNLRYITRGGPKTQTGAHQATLSLPESTNNSSQYEFAIQTQYFVTTGVTEVTSYSPWVPQGNLKVIVAAPEEVLADYYAAENEVRVYWTQPTPYGVGGYTIDYEVAESNSGQTTVAGQDNTELFVPAAEIPGYDPVQQTPLTGQVRATGQNSPAFIALGPRSPVEDVQYPEVAEAVLIQVQTSIDTFHNWLIVTDTWLNAENATGYTMYVGHIISYDPITVGGKEGFDKEWVQDGTVTGQATYKHYDATQAYATSVLAYAGNHQSTPSPWIPLITAVPQNIEFYFLYRADTNQVFLEADWDPIPDGANTVYEIQLKIGGLDPITVTTEPGQTSYSSQGPAEPGVAYSIQIRARDLYVVPEDSTYQVLRFGPWSDSVPAGTGGVLARSYAYDSAGRLRRAISGNRTTEYTYDVRDNLIQVQSKT